MSEPEKRIAVPRLAGALSILLGTLLGQAIAVLDQWLVQPQLNTVIDPDGKTIQLEPKVMEVLVYLADHAGEVVSKDALLQELWRETFVTENALTRCVAELRKIFRESLTARPNTPAQALCALRGP